MKNKEDRNRIILAIVLVVAVIALGIYKIFFNKEKIKVEKIDTETVSIVKNPNDFYTASSCVSKYLNYLTVKDKAKLLTLLSDDYKKANSITENNIDSYVDYLDDSYSFTARKMYVQRLSKSVYKFYIYGLLGKESMFYQQQSREYYIIVILDRSNLTFAIEPYDGSIFK